MQKGQIVRATEPFGDIVVTKLYEVKGVGQGAVILKGVRGYQRKSLFKIVEPDELEAIEGKVRQLQGQLVHRARSVGNFASSVTPEVVLGMVLLQLLEEERDGEVGQEVSQETSGEAGESAEREAGGAQEVDASGGDAETEATAVSSVG